MNPGADPRGGRRATRSSLVRTFGPGLADKTCKPL